METRIQTINDDTVMEVTEMVAVKKRHSEKNLLERKAYHEAIIAQSQESLDEINALLATITYEKGVKR